MAAGTVSLRYFILGLLTQQPMSGYDIKRSLAGLRWLIGSPSGGSLYPVLHALLQEDLVTVEVIPGVDRPPKKLYSLTGDGRQMLAAWLDQPAVPGAPLRAFVMRLLLAGNLPRARLLSHLRQRRDQVAAHHTALHQAAVELEDKRGQGRPLAQDYGMALATAELAWLDATLERLEERD
jgi:DNA-binding PadR family transcriptional regulator